MRGRELSGSSGKQTAPLDRAGRLAVLAVCLAFGATLLMKLGGADIWWHIRAGQWIVEQRSIPTTDPFSFTSEGPWRYTEALAQLLLAGVHALGGPSSIVLFNAALGVVLAAMVAGLTPGRAGTRGLVVGLFGACAHAAMTAKPQVFSYLCFAGLLLWLRAAEARGAGERSARLGRLLLPIPLLFVVWGNLHRGGVLGIAVIGAFLVAWTLRAERRRDARWLALVLPLATLGLMANSGGTFALASAFDVAGRESFAAHVAEWQPLSWALLAEHHLTFVPLLALAALGRLRRNEEGRLRLVPIDGELLVLLGTTFLAVRSARLVPFAAIAAAPAAGRAIEAALASLARRVEGKVRAPVLSAAALALGIALLGWRYTSTVHPAYWGLGVFEGRVPVRLAAFLERSAPPGHMFNTLDHGGYLIYALGPRQKVFIDGRNDTVYSEAAFVRALEAGSSRAAFARATEGYDIGFAIVPWTGPSERRFDFLHADPSWELVYWDDTGAVLVKRSEASTAYLARHGYRELSLHDAFRRVGRLGTSPEDRRFVEEVELQAERAPRSLYSIYLATLVYHQLRDAERYREARSRLARLAAERGMELHIP